MNFTVSIALLIVVISLAIVAWTISNKRPDISIWCAVNAACICVIIFYGNYIEKNITQEHTHPIVIIESITDNRNLTSVIYINSKGDTVGLDYLTYNELCNLK